MTARRDRMTIMHRAGHSGIPGILTGIPTDLRHRPLLATVDGRTAWTTAVTRCPRVDFGAAPAFSARYGRGSSGAGGWFALRSHCALYVDAGYLLAASATRITGTSLRSSIEADHERLIDALIAHATERSGLPLLRVHWYDAARDGVPDDSQQKIGLLPRVKLRLGRIGFDGEQKGVDLRIGLDLVAHARNAAVDAVFLVSGDDDLAEAVEEAQALGVQVTILAVPNKSGEPHGVRNDSDTRLVLLVVMAPHPGMK